MFITRPKRVPGPQYDIKRLMRRRKDNGVIVAPIDRVKQAKIYLTAKFKGASSLESARLAGLPPQTNSQQMMNAPESRLIIAELLKHEEFRDPGLAKRLKEMWTHKAVTIGKDGELVTKDDTDLWKYSMDKVLQLRGYAKEKEVDQTNILQATGGVTFNVLQVEK